MSAATAVGMVHVVAVRPVPVLMLPAGAVVVTVAVGMGVRMGVLMRMRGAVGMGMLVHVRMGVFVFMGVVFASVMGMRMGHGFLAKITTALGAHDYLLSLICFPSLVLKQYSIISPKQAPQENKSCTHSRIRIQLWYYFLARKS